VPVYVCGCVFILAYYIQFEVFNDAHTLNVQSVTTIGREAERQRVVTEWEWVIEREKVDLQHRRVLDFWLSPALCYVCLIPK